MSGNNEESRYQEHVPMADLRKHLKAFRPGNGGASTSVVGENPMPTGPGQLATHRAIREQVRMLSERRKMKMKMTARAYLTN